MNISEPAAAAAAGICWLHRWQRKASLHGFTVRTSDRHPSECGWCAFPLPELAQWLADFNFEDGDDHRLSQRFRSLPPDRQRALVIQAQAFEQVEATA